MIEHLRGAVGGRRGQRLARAARPVVPRAGAGARVQARRLRLKHPAAEPGVGLRRPAHRADALGKQRLGGEACGPVEVVAPHGQVDACVVQRLRAAAGQQPKVQRRVQRLKTRPEPQHPAHEKRGLARHRPAARLARLGAQAFGGAAHVLQRLGDGLRQRAAGVGQVHAALAALEQRQAQVGLQQRHGAADGAVRQVQLVPGAAEVLVARGRLKAAQRVQRGQACG